MNTRITKEEIKKAVSVSQKIEGYKKVDEKITLKVKNLIKEHDLKISN